MNKVLLCLLLIAVLLSSCLPEEDECHYDNLTLKNRYDHLWAVDTLHVFVYDSLTLYKVDTTYLNDGTFKFILSDPSGCKDEGSIEFTRADGSVITMQYAIVNYYYNYQIELQSTAIDGYPGAYNESQSEQLLEVDKIKVYPAYRSTSSHPKVVRYWAFTLRRR